MARPDHENYLGTGLLSADVTGQWVDMAGYTSVSFQVQHENADLVGSWILQGTNDTRVATPEALATVAVTAADETHALLTAVNVPVRFVRLFWDVTSGGAADNITYSNYYQVGRITADFQK